MRTTVIAMLTAGLVASSTLAAPPAAAPGSAQDCVFLANIKQSRVIDDTTIDFVMKDGRTLRNTLPNTCPGLGMNRAFGYETSLSQLCNVDIITVIVQGGGPRKGASCGLGAFTPIAGPAK
jgi:hypothetical protein